LRLRLALIRWKHPIKPFLIDLMVRRRLLRQLLSRIRLLLISGERIAVFVHQRFETHLVLVPALFLRRQIPSRQWHFGLEILDRPLRHRPDHEIVERAGGRCAALKAR
jgi:hypothetical protein